MKIRLLLSLILLSTNCLSQSAVIKELKQKDPFNGKLYLFPKIIVPVSDSVELKINTILRTEVLFLDTITQENKIFEQVWSDTDRMATLNNISYEIHYNSHYILSLSISAEGCGAYCESFTDYFTFNLNTGNKLTLDSFLAKTGVKVLTDSLNVSKTKRLKAEIIKILAMLKKKSVQADKEEKERYKEQLSMYTECLDNKIDPKYVDFMFRGKGLTIYSDRCSVHYNMAIDELWIFEYKVNLSRWAKYLSPFGKKVISK